MSAGPLEGGPHGPGQGQRAARTRTSIGYGRPGTSITGQSPRKRGHRPGVERRRHHEDPQVVARAPRLPREGQREVGVEAPLVELVEHDRAEAARAAGPTAAAASGPPRSPPAGACRCPKRRSKRTCQPTSPPSVQPCSSAIRRAIERAATRRGWSRKTGPSATSAGGTRVVLPEPGGATSTAARAPARASRTRPTCASIGSVAAPAHAISAGRRTGPEDPRRRRRRTPSLRTEVFDDGHEDRSPRRRSRVAASSGALDTTGIARATRVPRGRNAG